MSALQLPPSPAAVLTESCASISVLEQYYNGPQAYVKTSDPSRTPRSNPSPILRYTCDYTADRGCVDHEELAAGLRAGAAAAAADRGGVAATQPPLPPPAHIRNFRACECEGRDAHVDGFSCRDQAKWGKCDQYASVASACGAWCFNCGESLDDAIPAAPPCMPPPPYTTEQSSSPQNPASPAAALSSLMSSDGVALLRASIDSERLPPSLLAAPAIGLLLLLALVIRRQLGARTEDCSTRFSRIGSPRLVLPPEPETAVLNDGIEMHPNGPATVRDESHRRQTQKGRKGKKASALIASKRAWV